MKIVAVMLVSLVSLGLVTGCDKIAERLGQKAGEKAVEGATGGEGKATTNSDGTITITDKKNGTTVTGGGAEVKLPAGWPARVPIYPGASVRNALSSSGAKNATIVTKDPPAKVADFYKKCGLVLESEMDLGLQHMLVFKNGAKGNVTIMVSQSGTDTMASISITD